MRYIKGIKKFEAVWYLPHVNPPNCLEAAIFLGQDSFDCDPKEPHKEPLWCESLEEWVQPGTWIVKEGNSYSLFTPESFEIYLKGATDDQDK